MEVAKFVALGEMRNTNYVIHILNTNFINETCFLLLLLIKVV